MAFDLGTFGAKIELDSSKFNHGMSNAEGKMSGFTGKVGSFSSKVGKIAVGAIAGLGAAFVGIGTSAFAATKKVVSNLDEIGIKSKKMGVTTDAFQEMSYWAEQNGVSQGKMEKALGRLNQRMGKAADGNEKYSSALEAMGVNMDDVKDGSLSTEDAFAKTLQTLSGMTNEQEKSALASELYGTKMARDLLPALQDGSLSMEDAKKKAHELGLVIGEDSIDQAGKFQNTWDELTGMMGAFGTKILSELMPTFQGMMDWIIDHMPQIQSIFETTFEFVSGLFSGITTAIQTVVQWLQTWYENNQETINNIIDIFTSFVEMVTGIISSFIDTAVDVWHQYGDEILNFISTTFQQVQEIYSAAFDLIKAVVQTFVKIATQIWQKYGESIMSYAKKTFENIQKIISGVLDVIKGIIKTVTGLITGDWKKAWSGIKDIVKGVWSVIEGIVKQALMQIKAYITIIFNGIKSIASSVWNGIKSVISGVVSGISSTVSSIFNGMKSTVSGIFNGILSTAKSVFNSIKSAITSPIKTAVSVVKGLIGKLKSAMNFKWKLPKLKMPHVDVSMGKKMGIPYPKFNVKWYKKGGYFDKPTIAGIGEAGPEMAVPLIGKRMKPFAQAVAQQMGKINKTTTSAPQPQTASSNNHTYNVNVKIDKLGTDQKGVETFFNEVEKSIRMRSGR